jgi:hypothetical protein
LERVRFEIRGEIRRLIFQLATIVANIAGKLSQAPAQLGETSIKYGGASRSLSVYRQSLRSLIRQVRSARRDVGGFAGRDGGRERSYPPAITIAQ